MSKMVICEVCGFHIQNNPDKHKYRSKLCPNCRTPYTHSGLKIPFHILTSIEKTFQKIFNFFPNRKGKTISYVCPNRDCKFSTSKESEVTLEKFPDKTREVMVDGKPQTIVLSYRDIVTCPKCGTHMTRRRKQ